MLHEATLDLVKRRPLALRKIPAWLRRGKANLKHQIGELTQVDVTCLPYREEVLQLIMAAREQGRPVILATAASPQIAHAVAAHLNLFDEVLCSNENCNMASDEKSRQLVK